MKVVSYSELRRDLARLIEQAADDHEPILIANGGKPTAVLMSLDDYASHEETAYLLRSPANAKRLLASIKELEAGHGIEKKLID